MNYTYLISILISILGMLMLDWRHHLALYADARRTAITIAVGVLVFTIWDIIGIKLGIFFSGNSAYMSGLYIGPEFPIEELFFLTFLCYFTLIIYRLGETKWPRT